MIQNYMKTLKFSKENLSKNFLSFLAVIPIILVYTTICLIFFEFTVDDAFISFRYAENFTAGQNLVWNINFSPVEGYTNFLWIIILSLIKSFGISIVLSSKLLGIISGFLTIIIMQKVFRLFSFGNSYYLSSMPVIFITPLLSLHSVSGLETAFFTLLITLCFFNTSFIVIRKPIDDILKKRCVTLFILFVLLMLTRPEGIIIVSASLIALLKFNRNGRNSIIVDYTIIPFFIVMLVYAVLHFDYFGYLFPNTFYIKVASESIFKTQSLRYIAGFFLTLGVPFLLVSLIGFIENRMNNLYIILLLFTVPFVLFYLFVSTNVMGYAYRFLVPILPLLLIFFAAGLKFIFQKINRLISKKIPSILIIIILSLSATYFAFQNTSSYYDSILKVYVNGMKNAHIKLGKILGDVKNQDKTLVVAADAGAVPFYSKWHRVIDLGYLNDVYMTHKGFDLNYIIRNNPDAFVITSYTKDTLSVNLYDEFREQFSKHPILKSNYQLVTKFKFMDNYWLFVYLSNSFIIHNENIVSKLIKQGCSNLNH